MYTHMHAHTLQNFNFWKFFLSCLIPTSSDGILLSLLKDFIKQIFRLGLSNTHEHLLRSPKEHHGEGSKHTESRHLLTEYMGPH